MAALMDTYARLPVAFSHGAGAYLFDEQGNKYLDALAPVSRSPVSVTHTPALRRPSRVKPNSLMHTVESVSSVAAGIARATASRSSPEWTACSSATPARKRTKRRSRSRASTVTAATSTSRTSSRWRVPFTAARWRRSTATGNRKVQAGF